MLNSNKEATPLQNSDYQEVDDLLQEQATNLSPEAKAIISRALKRAKQQITDSASQSHPN
jgi:vacuolar-type H+-ATPase subunit H